MFCRAFCIVLAITVAAVVSPTKAAPVKESSSSAPPQDPLIRFHPVSQEQYDRILKMTGVKEDAPFELRHLQFDFKPFIQWRTSITNDFSTGWHRLLNFAGLEREDQGGSHNGDNNNSHDDFNNHDNNNHYQDDDSDSQAEAEADAEQVNGYPLCVVKTTEVPGLLGDDKVEGRRSGSYDGLGFGDLNLEPTEENNGRPVVNCVVVLKPKKNKPQQQQQYNYAYNENDEEEEVGAGGRPTHAIGRPDFGPAYPHSYYPMADYSAYPPPNERDEHTAERDEDNRRPPVSQLKAKTPKINRKSAVRPKTSKKSAMKAQSRQAYTPGYGVPYFGGYPQSIVGGLNPAMSYPYLGYGQSQLLAQPSYGNPLVMPSNIFGAPGAYSPYGDYGYGVGSQYTHDNDDDDSEEEDDGHYHYGSDHDEGDGEDYEHYGNDEGYNEGYDEDHYYDSDNYRSLKYKKRNKKHL